MHVCCSPDWTGGTPIAHERRRPAAPRRTSAAFERTPIEAQDLLRRPIRELGLRIEGSPVEPHIHALYEELQQSGLRHFRPACYLTDQWGCPSEEPVIGIPFYLADRRLGAIEREVNDLESDTEIMMYLRHEAGHAFNYAYALYRRPDWRDLFGPFRRAYRDEYRPVPFSKRYVRHIAGWYAQKHPDEDFAETFAVWMTPGSDWRRRYEGWPALRKLEWLDGVASDVADQPPLKPLGEIDFTVDDMDATVEDFYAENTADEESVVAGLPLDADLLDIFAGAGTGLDAAAVLREERKTMVDSIAYWSGVRRSLVKVLVETTVDRLASLGITTSPDHARNRLLSVTAYLSILAMNYLTRGSFTHHQE